jgi:glycosyltransferase involved in cell wall biosynthesis
MTKRTDPLSRPRVCIVATFDFAILVHFLAHIRTLASVYDLTVVTNTSDAALLSERLGGVAVHRIPFKRRISPGADLMGLVRLSKFLSTGRYDVVHSLMPKTGLLAMVASLLCRVPARVHSFTGQVWATKRGPFRLLLRLMDRLIATCATAVLVDSPSQREFIIQHHVVTSKKAFVLANGSICGVDTSIFHADDVSRASARSDLRLPQDDVVIVFLGRVNREKGLVELAEAFCLLRDEGLPVHLLIVGPDEEDVVSTIRQRCSSYPEHVHIIGPTAQPQYYLGLADILCLPSHREGFGSVIIEAAAMGVPSVASRIYGLTDAIRDGETGILFDPHNVEQLQSSLRRLVLDPQLRQSMGNQAYARAITLFSQEVVTAAMMQFYSITLGLEDWTHATVGKLPNAD